MSDIHQFIMDRAYARWQEHDTTAQEEERWDDIWSQEEFWQQLYPIEKVAVYCGNLNYQVENGGWIQWIDNGLAVCANELEHILINVINTDTSKHVAHLMVDILSHYDCVEKAREILDNSYELDCSGEDLLDIPRFDYEDDMYYDKYSEQFMKDVEEYLKREAYALKKSQHLSLA